MAIRFRYRKYGTLIDSSFFLVDGQAIAPLDHWHVGDEVSLLFDIEPEQAEAINRRGRAYPEIRAYSDSGGGHDPKRWYVHIPFLVVKRTHSASWRDTGRLQTIGTSVTLEATSGYWEDVFLWVCCGEHPEWAGEEE